MNRIILFIMPCILFVVLFSCSGVVRNNNQDKDCTIADKDLAEIISLARYAPSGHNTQPWTLKIKPGKKVLVGWDKSRALPKVDPGNRELVLSIGAFCEAFTIAARSKGYATRIKIVGKNTFASPLVELVLTSSQVNTGYVDALLKRRTIRNGQKSTPVSSDHKKMLLQNTVKPLVMFIDKADPKSRIIEKAVLDANIKQVERIEAQKELADWIRWRDVDAQKYNNGLTAESMEITGFAGWFVRNFYDREDVLSESFKEQTINAVKDQLKSYGMWIIITSDFISIQDLLSAGRNFYLLGLNGVHNKIALHPMTQPLEEHMQVMLQKKLQIKKPIQFIIRAGYVNDYAKPVSLRMPCSRFVK